VELGGNLDLGRDAFRKAQNDARHPERVPAVVVDVIVILG